jgi:dihydroorotate dehydrogenase
VIFELVARPVLFRLGGGDAEAAHDWTVRRLAALSRRPLALAALARVFAVSAPVEVFGLRFPNPVGLAAGVDKNGLAVAGWPALGFGFVELGTVTARAQPGNDRPRLFRLRDSQAVINRMGFNNDGADALAARLAVTAGVRRAGVPLGISIGKSKLTPLEDAVEDYLASLRRLHPYADYIAVNVSSPNTPGLRTLQDRAQLGRLLGALRAEADALAGTGRPTPLLVKIAPDLTEPAIGELLEVCQDHGVAGVIATNTTLGRDGLDPADRALAGQEGGLSGRPLAARAREVVAFVARESGGRLPVVGVGGITTPDDAVRLADAGASLVQLCTGLIYHGPGLARGCARAMKRGAAMKRGPAMSGVGR